MNRPNKKPLVCLRGELLLTLSIGESVVIDEYKLGITAKNLERDNYVDFELKGSRLTYSLGLACTATVVIAKSRPYPPDLTIRREQLR